MLNSNIISALLTDHSQNNIKEQLKCEFADFTCQEVDDQILFLKRELVKKGLIIPWNKPLPRLSTKAEKDLFIENFRGNGAAKINRLVPTFLL